MKIPESITVLKGKSKHTEYATCQSNLQINQIKRLITVYEVLLPSEAFSVELEFRPEKNDYIFTVCFDKKAADRARVAGVDLWFICNVGKVHDVLRCD